MVRFIKIKNNDNFVMLNVIHYIGITNIYAHSFSKARKVSHQITSYLPKMFGIDQKIVCIDRAVIIN